MSKLLSPVTYRDVVLRNRIVVSPMCQYSAIDGMANDWHLAHLARFALGGFGMVMVEATAVTPEGRITYADVGLWDDRQIAPLKRIAGFLRSQGAVPAIQLAHAGRKASSPIPWRGGFTESDAEKASIGFVSWTPVAPTAAKHTESYKLPTALDGAGIARLREAFIASARRALQAGFDVVEVHAAHGYLLNQFLSPVANKRSDAYGGSIENRMRLPLEVIEGVRSVWPDNKPVMVRISTEDRIAGGWTVDDSISFARVCKSYGVDIVDCSSGGFDGAAIAPGPFYQLPYAKAVKAGASIDTMTVGLVTDAALVTAALDRGDADLVALARVALDDPNWPQHAQRELSGAYDLWPKQSGYAIRAKDKVLAQAGQ